jgi:hypothetical protein
MTTWIAGGLTRSSFVHSLLLHDWLSVLLPREADAPLRAAWLRLPACSIIAVALHKPGSAADSLIEFR